MKNTGIAAVLIPALTLSVFAVGCQPDEEVESPKEKDPEEKVVSITNSDVRACDVLIDDTLGKVLDIRFAEGVEGHTEKWPPRIAASFLSTSDEAFADTPLEVLTSSEDSEINVLSVTCYDRLGQVVAEPGFSLGGS